MILNAYAVLDAFLTSARGFVAIAVITLSVSALRRSTVPTSGDVQRSREDQSYLLFLLAILLLVLNVASWPILYLLLQSYVAEWPEVMCIYGVTRIGAGSHGPARFMPTLVETLQWSKPLLVFLTGSWFGLYVLNRRTQTAPLMNRVLIALLVLGAVAASDAMLETAYLVTPKKEEFPAVGCCTAALEDSLFDTKRLPTALLSDNSDFGLRVGYYLVNLGLAFAVFLVVRSKRDRLIAGSLVPLLFGALVALPINLIFLREVAAPALLHLPYHHCVYDLIVQVPESVVGIALFFLESFAVGWSCLAAWLGDCSETRPALPSQIRDLLCLSLFGNLGSMVLMTVALAIE